MEESAADTEDEAQNAGHQDKTEEHAGTGFAHPAQSCLSLAFSLFTLNGIVRSQMTFAVEVRHIIVEALSETCRASTWSIVGITSPLMLMRGFGCTLCPLFTVLAPTAVAVEGRRRALELGASLAEARCWTTTCWCAATATIRSGRIVLRRWRSADKVPVVASTLIGAS